MSISPQSNRVSLGLPTVLGGSLSQAAMPDASRRDWSYYLFAAVMIGLGLLGITYGDFALVWQPMPVEHMPGQVFLAYLTALVELAVGVALLIRPLAEIAARALWVFLMLWVVLLRLPGVVKAPLEEISWLGVGETTVILAGGWVLVANLSQGWLGTLSGARGITVARLLFALALPMIGLSHFVYNAATAGYVPTWLPWHPGWAYLTGAGSLAACLGLLFGVYPRLAAVLEAAMLSVITLLVWLPGLVSQPADRLMETAFLISTTIAAGAWVVADSYRGVPWLHLGGAQKSS